MDRLVVTPAARRDAVLELLRSARHTLILSLFRCDDLAIVELFLQKVVDAMIRDGLVYAMLGATALSGGQYLWRAALSMKNEMEF